MESARMVTKARPTLDYGIDFVAFSLEELHSYGTQEMQSYIDVNSLRDQMSDLIGMINFERIGCFNEDDQPYPDPRLKTAYPQKAMSPPLLASGSIMISTNRFLNS